MSITSSKKSITLGETVTITYACSGAYNTTIQGDNMPNALDLGDGDVSGTMKFLPVTDGDFKVTLTAYGVVHQSKGIDNMSNTEINYASVTVNVN